MDLSILYSFLLKATTTLFPLTLNAWEGTNVIYALCAMCMCNESITCVMCDTY